MASPGKQLCLVLGTPRGFTRSVLESLLKRGSRVLLSCRDTSLGDREQARLSSLYGKNQIHFAPADPGCPLALEALFVQALDTFGEIHLIVNSTANDPLRVTREELEIGPLNQVEQKLDLRLQQQDVEGIRRVGDLALRYQGKHQGGQGGSLLNLVSDVELCPSLSSGPSSSPMSEPLARGSGCSQCTVLGVTRALGLHRTYMETGLRVTTVYQPTIDYPDLSQAAQITDDSHSPHNKWDRHSAYIRDYTGYMSLHTGDAAPSGTAWAFNNHIKLEEVQPESLERTCALTNKMCYWMGCPLVADTRAQETVASHRTSLGSQSETGLSLKETQETMD